MIDRYDDLVARATVMTTAFEDWVAKHSLSGKVVSNGVVFNKSKGWLFLAVKVWETGEWCYQMVTVPGDLTVYVLTDGDKMDDRRPFDPDWHPSLMD